MNYISEASEKDETNFSAQQLETQKNPWLSGPHEHQGRRQSNKTPAGQREKTAFGLSKLTPGVQSPRTAQTPSGFPWTMARFRYKKADRLRKRSEFLSVSRGAGTRLATKNFLIFLKPNQVGRTRLGVTVTKKVGSAVTRNRIKRQVREFFRLHKPLLPQGRDIVVIAHRGAAELNQPQVREELKVLIDRPVD